MATYKVTQYIGADQDYGFTPAGEDNEIFLTPHQVLLDGPDAPNTTVTVNKLQDGDPPAVGDELIGEIIKSKYGYRFKKDSSGFQSSSNGSGDKFDRRPDHPRQEARAIHTSAMSAAPGYVDQILTVKAADQPKDWEGYWTLVETVIAKLEATYELPDR